VKEGGVGFFKTFLASVKFKKKKQKGREKGLTKRGGDLRCISYKRRAVSLQKKDRAYLTQQRRLKK